MDPDLWDQYQLVIRQIDKAERGTEEFDQLHREADAILQRIEDAK